MLKFTDTRVKSHTELCSNTVTPSGCNYVKQRITTHGLKHHVFSSLTEIHSFTLRGPLIQACFNTYIQKIHRLTLWYIAENNLSLIVVQEMFIEILTLTGSFWGFYSTRGVVSAKSLHG